MKHINALLNDKQATNLKRILDDYLELTKDNDGDVRKHQFWSSSCTQNQINELIEVLT